MITNQDRRAKIQAAVETVSKKPASKAKKGRKASRATERRTSRRERGDEGEHRRSSASRRRKGEAESERQI